MARDIQDKVGQFLGSDNGRQLVGAAVNQLLSGLGNEKSSPAEKLRDKVPSDGPLSGARGIAAGAGAAALAPIAVKGVGKLIKGAASNSLTASPKKLAAGAASKLGDSVGDKVTGKIDEAGGPAGVLKDTVKSALPGGGGGGGPKGGVDGVGKGRRMPVQQHVDIAAPIETVYNQWTQFEEWPLFMHRVTRVSQEDPCTVSFATKIWGKTKEFTAKIETQRPDERIKWSVSQGMTHTGLVTFHELGPRLTRVDVDLDIQPGSLIEKFARGARHVKRAARGDLHRFKAFIEMLENETGAWRGVIEEGELVEDHDPSYDKKREYGSADELLQDSDAGDDHDSDAGEDQDGNDPEKRRGRSGGRSGAGRSSGSSSRSRSAASSSRSRSRSTSSRGGKSGGSSRSQSSGSSSRSRKSTSGSSRSRSSGGSRSSSNGSSGSSGSRASGGTRSSGTQSRQRARSSRRG